jgi:putative ABC transport system substrate-binding protein
VNERRGARRGWAWCLVWLAIAGAGCAALTGRPGTPDAQAAVVDPPARAGMPVVFIAMPASPSFLEVRKSLVSEVRKTFDVRTFVVTPDTTAEELGAAIRRAKPACAVLMNNATMTLLRTYETSHRGDRFPPTILLMASLIEEVQPTLEHATGIAYEVPGVTAFVNLRAVIDAPVRRVGVIYRPLLRKFVERQRRLAAREHIELVAVAVPTDVTAEGLRDALAQLIRGRKIDAIWMLNDNALVRDAQFLDDAWRAELREAKVPLVVGAANLVDPASPLGTLAVVPDHEALGLQAANLIFELADDGWRVDAHRVELPLSVKTVVDVKAARASFGLRPEALRHIDVALQ